MYPNMYIRYYTSIIILTIDSNTVCLVIPKSKSRIAGYFQLTNYLKRIPHLLLNRAILLEYEAPYYIVSLVAEVEIPRVFCNTQIVVSIWYILEYIRY